HLRTRPHRLRRAGRPPRRGQTVRQRQRPRTVLPALYRPALLHQRVRRDLVEPPPRRQPRQRRRTRHLLGIRPTRTHRRRVPPALRRTDQHPPGRCAHVRLLLHPAHRHLPRTERHLHLRPHPQAGCSPGTSRAATPRRLRETLTQRPPSA